MLKASAAALLGALPGPRSAGWPEGERFARAFAHGTMSVELYAPLGIDRQKPHAQDELYIVHSGSGVFLLEGERCPFGPGDAYFVPAGADHCFEDFSEDFATWVVFWGPPGGEAHRPT
jgi:mannose-6-phosphate isomerase-like protein (cupin superfamily)